ncbi:hypothetical protein FB446DRAFT_748175 [Lentinula raphanica]|nr:hypothetical protein FB446DRAFT_748175 [Lentinula raphanica]
MTRNLVRRARPFRRRVVIPPLLVPSVLAFEGPIGELYFIPQFLENVAVLFLKTFLEYDVFTLDPLVQLPFPLIFLWIL